MNNHEEEYQERISIASLLYEGQEEEWKNEFPILKEMSDEEVIKLLAKTVVSGIINRWNK